MLVRYVVGRGGESNNLRLLVLTMPGKVLLVSEHVCCWHPAYYSPCVGRFDADRMDSV
jgi:hypothetical protein